MDSEELEQKDFVTITVEEPLSDLEMFMSKPSDYPYTIRIPRSDYLFAKCINLGCLLLTTAVLIGSCYSDAIRRSGSLMEAYETFIEDSAKTPWHIAISPYNS